MTWFKVDDKLWGHPKYVECSPEAKALWLTAGSWSSSYKTDGELSHAQLGLLAPIVGVTVPKVRRLAVELTERRMWTSTDTGFRFHNWTDFNPSRAQQDIDAAIERERKKISRDPDLRAAIRLRDQDMCRYCGERVNFAARTGHLAGRYDHVVPVTQGGKTLLNNVVVACDYHNRQKLDKTPAEAGLTLLDPPEPERSAHARPGLGLAPAEPVQAASSGRVGSGRARTGQDDTGRSRHVSEASTGVPPDDDSFPGEDVA